MVMLQTFVISMGRNTSKKSRFNVLRGSTHVCHTLRAVHGFTEDFMNPFTAGFVTSEVESFSATAKLPRMSQNLL